MRILRVSFEDNQGNGPVVIVQGESTDLMVEAAKQAVSEELGMSKEDVAILKPSVLDITGQEILSVNFISGH